MPFTFPTQIETFKMIFSFVFFLVPVTCRMCHRKRFTHNFSLCWWLRWAGTTRDHSRQFLSDFRNTFSCLSRKKNWGTDLVTCVIDDTRKKNGQTAKNRQLQRFFLLSIDSYRDFLTWRDRKMHLTIDDVNFLSSLGPEKNIMKIKSQLSIAFECEKVQ